MSLIRSELRHTSSLSTYESVEQHQTVSKELQYILVESNSQGLPMYKQKGEQDKE